MNDSLAWWNTWGRHPLQLQVIALKVMKLPTSVGAGERAFSNAGHIQPVLRTSPSYKRLHRLLYIDFNCRVIPEADVDSVLVPDMAGCVNSDDDTDSGSVGSDASLSNMATVSELLAEQVAAEDGVYAGGAGGESDADLALGDDDGLTSSFTQYGPHEYIRARLIQFGWTCECTPGIFNARSERGWEVGHRMR